MNTERDKFLMEHMGLRWVEGYSDVNIKLSPWEFFGEIFMRAKRKEWWHDFAEVFRCEKPEEYINPDRFANAVYDYLKKDG